MKLKAKRVEGYRGAHILVSDTTPTKRLIVGIPMTGSLRAEWVLARYGQVIPCNWSQMDIIRFIDSDSPLRFMVADARNAIVANAIRDGFEWLLFIDHDVVLPPLTLLTMNEYMLDKKYPLLSGLYFTKSVPSEPLIYRGRGNSYYKHWKLGDKVAVDGLPMGITLIHHSLLKAVWDDSPEYMLGPEVVRRVFETPTRVFYDPETKSFNTQSGTEDLEFCSRVIKHGLLAKAGWPKLQKEKYPFLIDTRLFCWHIDPNGTRYPTMGEHMEFVKTDAKAKRKKATAPKGF